MQQTQDGQALPACALTPPLAVHSAAGHCRRPELEHGPSGRRHAHSCGYACWPYDREQGRRSHIWRILLLRGVSPPGSAKNFLCWRLCICCLCDLPRLLLSRTHAHAYARTHARILHTTHEHERTRTHAPFRRRCTEQGRASRKRRKQHSSPRRHVQPPNSQAPDGTLGLGSLSGTSKLAACHSTCTILYRTFTCSLRRILTYRIPPSRAHGRGETMHCTTI